MSTAPETTELVKVKNPPPCESRYHLSDRTKVHAGPAAGFLIARYPCCGRLSTGLRCRPILEWIEAGKPVKCLDCNRVGLALTYTIHWGVS